MTNELKIAEILKDLGVPATSGYFYLKYAVELMKEDITLSKAITKRLYPMIAKKFNTTNSAAERCIRHAIQVAWNRGNLETQDRLFGFTVDVEKGCPTNGEFIVTVADWLRMTESHQEDL